jgi:hypothetical protein
MNIPQEDQQLLIKLSNEKGINYNLISNLVEKAIEIRYQNKPIGFKDEISDLIKKYANDKKEIL